MCAGETGSRPENEGCVANITKWVVCLRVLPLNRYGGRTMTDHSALQTHRTDHAHLREALYALARAREAAGKKLS